jgi:hypothetical protein
MDGEYITEITTAPKLLSESQPLLTNEKTPINIKIFSLISLSSYNPFLRLQKNVPEGFCRMF